MLISIQRNEFIDITLQSLRDNVKTPHSVEVVDNDDKSFPSTFYLKGDSLKIFTKQFDRIIKQLLPKTDEQGKEDPNVYYARKYPGASLHNDYPELYRRNDLDPNEEDHDISLTTYYTGRYKYSVLPLNLNCKDDLMMSKVLETKRMINHRIWTKNSAGILNYSKSMLLSREDESILALLYYMPDIKIDDHQIQERLQYRKQLYQEFYESIINAKVRSRKNG